MPKTNAMIALQSTAAKATLGAVVVAGSIGTWIALDSKPITAPNTVQAGLSGSGEKVAGISGSGSPEISAPIANATVAKEFGVSGTIAGISGSGDTVASSVTSVQVLVNGQAQQTVKVVRGNWRAILTAPSTGQLALTAKAFAGQKLVGTQTISVYCCLENNTSATSLDDLPEQDPFALAILAPVIGTTVEAGSTMLRGSTSAGGKITVLIDGQEVRTVTANDQGQWQQQIAFEPGEYRVQVRNEINSIADRMLVVEPRIGD